MPARKQAARPDTAQRLVIVLGDQLDINAPLIQTLDPARDLVLMMEVAGESSHTPSHKQRTVLFLSAMRHFADALRAAGNVVRYITLDDPLNTGSLNSEVARAVRDTGASSIALTLPGEHRVHTMAMGWSTSLGIPVDILPDDHFLTTPDEFRDWATGRKDIVMEYFYRWQRKRLGILVDDDGKPEGGCWNYDDDNRQPLKAAPRLRPPRSFKADATTRAVIDTVNRLLPDLPGRINADTWRWPVTRDDALAAFDDFIDHRLAGFGPYEDAMWTDAPFLYHSLMSAAMNLKLIGPREMWPRIVKAYRAGRIPLNSAEGFIRQIIGWREFIRAVYWREGPSYADRNALGQTGRLPGFYWTADTDMHCMRQCLGQVLDHGFGHHIQRLMVTGNFALIAGVHPRAVTDWYLGMYVDAVDWVTLPNTLGMSQHADGGIVGTKPYAASGKYISRMSNYCHACRYNVTRRTGDDACPFNTLYWDFLIRHRQTFRNNHRMAMIMKNVDRLDPAEATQITLRGQALRTQWGIT